MSGIRFVSKNDIDAKKEAVKAAKEARELEAKEEAKARRAETQVKQHTGEAGWIAPALERRLQGKASEEPMPHRKEKHKKGKHKKDKHKKEKGETHKKKHKSERSGASEPATHAGSDSDSSTDNEGRGGRPGSPPDVRTSGVPATAGASRAAAGLDWMQRPPPKTGSAFGASGAREAPAAPAPEAEPSISKRVALELNPYARDGVELNDWKPPDDGVARPTAPKVAGTDGGRSWQIKKMQRVVQEAQDKGLTLEEVCHLPRRNIPCTYPEGRQV